MCVKIKGSKCVKENGQIGVTVKHSMCINEKSSLYFTVKYPMFVDEKVSISAKENCHICIKSNQIKSKFI